MVAWHRGRIGFSVTTDDPASEGPTLVLQRVQQQDARIAALPSLPERIGAVPDFMPSDAKQLELYQALADRTLPDDVVPGETDPRGVSTIGNVILQLDAAYLAKPRPGF